MNRLGRTRRKRNGYMLGRLERLERREVLSSVTEFGLAAASGPYGITPGPDGALWFTENASNKIGRITTSGTVTEYTIPTSNSGPQGITTGPDGALWFTENASNKIGRITTDGTFTEYALAAGSHPMEIAAGPDGNLWFTENGTNKVGEIVPSGAAAGTITEFSLAANSSPWGITGGPDGNVWFTENGADKVASIVPSGAGAGTISEFSLSGGAGPRDITTGSDGNLWFIEEGGTNIGRVTTGGSVTEFATPDGDHPNGIVSGPGGALFYTPFYTDDIGAVTTSGVFTSYAIPTSTSRTIGITTGPDGHIWFAEANASQIGRLNLDPVGSNDSYSYQKNTALVVGSATGVLANDTDPEGDALSVSATSVGNLAASHGTVTLAADGSFTYTPDANYVGPDSFSYVATDGSDSSQTVTVNLTPSIVSTTLTVSNATGIYGGTTTVQAHLTAAGGDVAGELVDFKLGSLDLGTATTNASGIASIPNVALTALHAGTLTGDVTASFAGDASYDVSGGSADLIITPAPLTITADNQSKVYGAALPTLTASYSGFVNGDTAASLASPATLTTTATAASHVGSDPITASGAASNDYTITYVNGTLAVTPATLTVTPVDLVKPYGVALPTLTATYSGFVNGDTAASLATPIVLATAATADSDFGSYPITASGGSSPNYAIVYNTGTLTVPADPAGVGFVTSVYEEILRRAPEVAGLDGWLARMNNGMSQAEVIDQIYHSPEAVTLRIGGGATFDPTAPAKIALITALYEDVLGRSPETYGLDGWLDGMAAGMNPAQVAALIEASPEAVARRAAVPTPPAPTADVEENLIGALYLTILDREPEPAGLDTWMSRLEGGETADHMALVIYNSPEAIANRRR